MQQSWSESPAAFLSGCLGAPMLAQRQIIMMRAGSEGTSVLQRIYVQRITKCDMVPGYHGGILR